jgi:hypothetical protein
LSVRIVSSQTGKWSLSLAISQWIHGWFSFSSSLLLAPSTHAALVDMDGSLGAEDAPAIPLTKERITMASQATAEHSEYVPEQQLA